MPSLLSKISSRKLTQWTLAYLAVAWFLFEAFDTLRDYLGLSANLFPLLAGILGFGLIVTLIVGWFHGEKGQQNVSGAEILLIGVVFAAAAVILPWLVPGPDVSPDGSGTPRTTERPSIAVLPFENFSPDADDAYFSNGITDEITHQLSRIRGIRVVSRTAVARALETGLTLEAIGTLLAATHILEGSVRKAGEQLKITARLTDTEFQAQLWSADFERTMADVFAIQEEVGLSIVDTLKANLTVPERSAIQSTPTQNLEAYKLYLRSGALNSTSPDENARAIRMLEQALVLDPTFTQAKLAIAHRHQWMAMLGDETHSAKARQLATEVLDQDPASSDALYLLATAAFSAGHVRESLVWMDRALQIDPDHHDALVDKGYLQTESGQLADGLDLSSRGLLSALNTANARFHVAWPLLALADDSRTRRWLDVAALEVPAHSRLDLVRIALEFRSGNFDEARRLALTGLTRWAGVNEFEVFASDALHLLGDIENARAALQMSARQSPDAKPYGLLSKRSPRLSFALILEQSGDQAGAADLMAAAHASAEKAIAAGNEWFYPHIDLATVSIVRGETVDALAALERARASGYRDFRTLRLDPVFEPLHGHVRFEALLAEMETQTSAERARAQARGYYQIVDEIISAAESSPTD